MSGPVTFTVDVTVAPGGGTPVACLVGVPGREGEVWIFRADDGVWRPLWPTRDLPARLPDRAIDGVPALGAIVLDAFPDLAREVEHA
jgi:hypothetical protein